MLTAARKAIIKSHLKYELEILILNERRLRQGTEVTSSVETILS